MILRQTLRKKYSILLFSVGAVVAIIFTVAATYTYRNILHSIQSAYNKDTSNVLLNLVVTRGETITNILAEELVNPLYYYDLDSIYQLLHSAKSAPNILEALIVDTNCHVIHDGIEEIPSFKSNITEVDHCLEQRGDAKNLTVVHSNHVTTSKPLVFGEKSLGVLIIKLSLEETKGHIVALREQLLRRERAGSASFVYTILAVTVLLTLFSLVAARLLAARLIEPIELLRYHAKKIGKGDYSEPIRVRNRDEIGDLAESLEAMRLDLKSSTVSIEELQREIREKQEIERQREKTEYKLLKAQKMESIGQLAAGVAHDLNNILSGIVSLPQLLLLKIPHDSPLRPSLETIQNSGEHAAHIVQDMLTLSKGGVNIDEVVNLTDIVEEYLRSPERLKIKDTHPGISINTIIENDVLNIKGSRVHLLKLLMNLVNNAADAIYGKGTITLNLENRYADQDGDFEKKLPAGAYVYLGVRDTGVGISSENLQYVFDPFFSKKSIGRTGTGLGMVIVKNTIDDHQGYIFLESEQGVGTTVHLYFPGTREQLGKKAVKMELEQIVGNDQTVLVVDDIEAQRDIAKMILESLNYSVVAVSSGEQAIEFLETNMVDLIILDMMMEPGISGLETTKKILRRHPDARILIASGYSESGMVRQSIELGAKQFIQKPYTVETIGRAVLDILKV